MTLTLNQSDWDELQKQAPVTCPDHLKLEDFEELSVLPEVLGRGYELELELMPGVRLCFADHEWQQDTIVKTPAHDHPIQISIFPSGALYFDAVHPNLGDGHSYFSGSGISPSVAGMLRAGRRWTCVDIEIDPELFSSGFLTEQQRDSDLLKPLLKQDDWKVSFYPTLTPAMQTIAQQMWDVPYRGELKRLYLQAKVMELLVIYLDWVAEAQQQPVHGLKPDTVTRLHHAKELLATQVEQPPTLVELAQQVGVSKRTLQRGFRDLFGTTVFGYLHTLRMKQAEQLLRNRQMRVSEVAHAVGYSHPGHFTEAFKRTFGMTPKQC